MLMYAPVTIGSEKDPLPVGDWKVVGRLVEPHVQLQSRSVLGCRSDAREGENPRWAEQPGRCRLGRYQQGTFRIARHAGALYRRAHRIARVHPSDQLGCDETGYARGPGDQSHDSMSIRHRRRSVQVEAVAPWVTLSVILLIWWAGATALNWVRPRLPGDVVQRRRRYICPKARRRSTRARMTRLSRAAAGPTISANTMVLRI